VCRWKSERVTGGAPAHTAITNPTNRKSATAHRAHGSALVPRIFVARKLTAGLSWTICRIFVAYMDRLPDVRLMGFSWADGDHNLTMMMVVPDSAGDAS